MKLFLLLALVSCAHAIDWSSPQTLYSSGSLNGQLPQIAIDATAGTIQAVWLTDGATTIYGSSYNEEEWSSPVEISASSGQEALQILSDGQGHYLATWDIDTGPTYVATSAMNVGGVWMSPQSLMELPVTDTLFRLFISSSKRGIRMLSWQISGYTGIMNQLGKWYSPYPITEINLSEVVEALTYDATAIEEITSLYSTTINPLSPFESSLTYPIFVVPVQGSFSTDSNETINVIVFQDMDSLCLISSFCQNEEWFYFPIVSPIQSISSIDVAIHPHLQRASVAWQLSSGEIHAAIFDGKRWVHQTTLSSSGASPVVAIDPNTFYTIVAWADSTSGNKIQQAQFDLTSWSSPQTISASGYAVSNPQIALNANGQGSIIWTRKATSSSKFIVEAVTAE
jgi:hypothetical protein